jgi:hypothetical protein
VKSLFIDHWYLYIYEEVEKRGDVCSVMIVAVGEVTATINACDFSYPFLDDQLIIYCNRKEEMLLLFRFYPTRVLAF